MSLTNKFLRYFHRVHFGQNKKHNLVPSHLPQTKVGFTGTCSSRTTFTGGWWGRRGWDREGLSGISVSYRCGMWYANESLRICVLTSARSSSLIWKQHVVVVHACIDPCNLVREPCRVRTLFRTKNSRTFKDTFPIFHFYCCGLAETTGARWLNFVLHDQKVYLLFTQNIKTRALGSLQFLLKTTTIFYFE